MLHRRQVVVFDRHGLSPARAILIHILQVSP